MGNRALQLCKEQNLVPYYKSDVNKLKNSNAELEEDIISIIKGKSYINIKYEKNQEKKEIIIQLNTLSINYLKIIIDSMKLKNETIKFNDNIIYDYNILSKEESKQYSLKLMNNILNLLKFK